MASTADDGVNKLSFLWTSGILLIVGTVLTSMTYFGKSFACYTPRSYSEKWRYVTEQKCYRAPLYFFPSSLDVLPVELDQSPYAAIEYYPYTHWILLFASMCFLGPWMFWNKLKKHRDIPLDEMCSMVEKIWVKLREERTETIREIGNLMIRKLAKPHTTCWIPRLHIGWILTKALYICNAWLQFAVLAFFFGHGYNFQWGWIVSKSLWNREGWEETGFFPMTVFCETSFYTSNGYLSTNAVQCDVYYNIFMGKFLVGLWFWYLIVIAFATIDFIYTLVFTSFSRISTNSVVRLFMASESGDERSDNKNAYVEFTNIILSDEGVLMLNFMENQNDVVAQEIARYIYEKWMEHNRCSLHMLNKLMFPADFGYLKERSIKEAIQLV